MSKHSPGPWHQGGSALLNNVYDVAGGHVATATNHDAVAAMPVNARLIAAAPEMLMLLQRSVVAIEPGLRGRGVWGEIEALLKRIEDD